MRYGRDVGYAPHQALLREVHQATCPDVMLMEPNCRPWSISFNRCTPEKVAEEPAAEKPCLDQLQSSPGNKIVAEEATSGTPLGLLICGES
jgi:hypothetical protein